MRPPVHDQSARALVTRMRGGETSAVAVTTAFLEQIAAREGEVHAFAFLDPAAALAAAERCDAAMAAGARAGPLHGLPVAVKDIIDTADMPTEYGGEIFAGRRPARDATIVRRLRNAGAVVLGKTVTSQYALFVPGPTRNPHDLAHTPGGSSSGSAAAVAANFAPVALGTQTNGSVIRPASYCGIVGFKPSLGLLPRTGVLRHAALIDHPGVLARNVADAALIVDAIAGEDPEDSLSRDPPGALSGAALDDKAAPRLAVAFGPFESRAEPATRDALKALVAGLAGRRRRHRTRERVRRGRGDAAGSDVRGRRGIAGTGYRRRAETARRSWSCGWCRKAAPCRGRTCSRRGRAATGFASN